MIAIVAIGVVALVWRIAAKSGTREVIGAQSTGKCEAALLASILIAIAMTALQSLAEAKFTKFKFPEMRYWWQVTIPFFGYAVWGMKQLLDRRNKTFFPRVMIAMAVLFTAYLGVMLAKAHVPAGRRNAYMRVCEWAAPKIKADWKGPAADESVKESAFEYRILNRPIVQAHTARLPYILGGRHDAASNLFADDTPDYICNEEKKIDFSDRSLHGAKYELMDKCQIGKRKFALYRRAQ